ncbi:MAG: T9SS type A sorting domain-containing protein [Melioribacteraceae bacterium]|nr:T9SS type A sorting domain-containing protein [Melioribacteraceae bacterium]MCF8352981.1 T9SS type A sorting domain-containing protein [Melioribacteraceae bacterium]MCF8395364.1 T9SS type A sorting domain-containing protein [Melioribacteraceae bacterium]MCF8417834.1 T9SS type A sorting domain-containing protein [Melioribacteraceae bacterium]
MRVYSALLVFIITGTLYAQNYKSTHRLDSENYGIKNIRFENTDSIPRINSSFKKTNRVNSKLDRNVFGFLPDWEYLNGSADDIQYDLLSHIAFFDFAVDSLGNLSLPAGWPWTDVFAKADEHGVKLIMSVVNFDADNIHELLTNETAKQNLFNNIQVILYTYYLDGVNIDFEGLYESDRGSLINSFMSGLNSYLDPGYEVSFAAPAVNWGGWDFTGLANSCDYLFVMGYDYYGSWSEITAPVSPLTGGSHNLTNSIEIEYASVPSEKLILGLPYYGARWRTDQVSEGAAVNSFVFAPRFRSAVNQALMYGRNWSNNYNNPWIWWNEDEVEQLWYDDIESMGLKFDLAIENNLKGIGIWALGYDGNRPELWNLIDFKLGGATGLIPSEPYDLYTNVTETGVQIHFSNSENAQGYRLYFSDDGINFTDSVTVVENAYQRTFANPNETEYVKVRAFNTQGYSYPSDVLAYTTVPAVPWNLIVNGFDRTYATQNPRNYIHKYAEPMHELGYLFNSASNEAVAKGLVDLSPYDVVVWMLGDESFADDTFNPLEQNAVQEYLINGGHMLISGSEIGYDLMHENSSTLDNLFYTNILDAVYVSDAPNDLIATYYTAEIIPGILTGLPDINYDDGSNGTFNVAYPDAIQPNSSNSYPIMKYKDLSVGAGYAGIRYLGEYPGGTGESRIVYVSFPVETIYPDSQRKEFLRKALQFLDSLLPVEKGNAIVDEFRVYQNYPNPFNPNTTMSYFVPADFQDGNVMVKIFDALGNEIETINNKSVSSGFHKIDFDASELSSGIYFYRITFNNGFSTFTSDTFKMVLIK